MSKRYSKKTIECLINSIRKKIKKKVEIIAIGGTALALLNERLYSKDIDLCYGDLYPPEDIAQIILDAANEEGLEMPHIFKELEMSLLNIPDFAKRAVPYPEFSSKHLSFKIMHPEDIVLHKIYRGQLRDRSDIKRLLDSGKVNMASLQARFHKIVKHQELDVRKEFIEKFGIFVKAYTKSK